MSLGERIKKQRKKSGLSQEKLAELVGVSRQAVTKWENGQSAPSTENLFRLAEVFGTTVDMLLNSDEKEQYSPAEQIYDFYKMEQEKKAEDHRARLKKNVFSVLAVAAGYVIIYLAGRFFGTAGEQTTVIEWLLGDNPQQLSYLYGWLLHQNIYWIAMAVSVIPALFGKKYVALTTLIGFAVGLLAGELCGHNPAGAAFGYGHYGWLIWGSIFVFSMIMGMILEKLSKRKLDLKSRKLWVWSASFIAGMFVIVLLVRMSMPTDFI